MKVAASMAPEIKGWCPGALRPMLSGDGWLVRVRPHLGRLSQDQAQGLARLANAHGNGMISLSNRANVQLRGVREDGLSALTAGLQALGLLDADESTEARRNILVTPFADDLAYRIAAGLETALSAPDAPDLPGKFGFAVDTGDRAILRAAPADIRIERQGDALVVRADGAATGAMVTVDTAVLLTMELARWFVVSGGAGRGRMATHVAQGVTLPPQFAGAAQPVTSAFERRGPGSSPGWGGMEIRAPHQDPKAPAPGRWPPGFLAGFEFGQISAQGLTALAAIGPLRLTPWRMVLIEGLRDVPVVPGLITDPDDPRLRVIACIGAPGCAQGRQETQHIARALACHVPAGQMLHVSGCAKGCAHPGLADVTLVGHADGFGIIHGGNAGATAARVLPRHDLLSDPARLFRGPDAAHL